MELHEKMHACIQELATQVQTLQQNASIQNRSMERIEEVIVSECGDAYMKNNACQELAKPRVRYPRALQSESE